MTGCFLHLDTSVMPVVNLAKKHTSDPGNAGTQSTGPVAMHNPATAALRACSRVGTIRQ